MSGPSLFDELKDALEEDDLASGMHTSTSGNPNVVANKHFQPARTEQFVLLEDTALNLVLQGAHV